MEQGTTGPIHFLNLEYFFRLLYESRLGAGSVQGFSFRGVIEWMLHTWGLLSMVSFLFSLFALGLLVYASIRMYQITQIEHHRYGDIEPTQTNNETDHARWAHIQTLIESPHDRDWRIAIMEADIMLEDALRERGYEGETVGDKLRNINSSRLKTLQEAGEAHGVRNRIAHEGSAYVVDDKLAYRTIKKYESVFKELGEI